MALNCARQAFVYKQTSIQHVDLCSLVYSSSFRHHYTVHSFPGHNARTMAENPPKRPKTSESEDKIECDALQNFKGFKIKRILNQNLTSKSVFLLGNLYTESSPGSAGDASSGTPEGGVACDDADPQSSGDDQAVVLLEKTAFTEDLLPTLMSEKSVLNRSMQNDIYGVYECFPPKELSSK